MAGVLLTTYLDLIQHAVDFLEGDTGGTVDRDARRAALAAYRDLANAHPWTLYYDVCRINTQAPFLDGTIQYQESSGTYPRQVTLQGASWPSWAQQGKIRLPDAVNYQVAQVISPTVLTLSVKTDPGKDFPAGSSYTLTQDSFPLPSDFISQDEPINVNNVLTLTYCHPRMWQQRQRFSVAPAFPALYTIMGSEVYFNTLAMHLYPAPDAVYQLDFLYRRRPRQLQIDDYHAGTVTVGAGANTVTGTGTNWSSRYVGSVLRFSGDAVNLPGSRASANPFLYERVITAVSSATQLTLDFAVPQALTGVLHAISDPVEVEDGVMLTALHRCIEKQLAIQRNMKERTVIAQQYEMALVQAKEADSRSTARRHAGEWGPYFVRFANMPSGPDLG